ncbi:MAG: acyl-ACP--UDP-N-acetylglucosamine O-acyltransferase [Lentisphaerae bacterium]|nr:MAG: acyl-ACP--UDP-N-acetylglucosamine O-acyltransferase [Lentisphaerota bacterium]
MNTKNDIHPSAVIEEGAVLGKGNKIGPFCYIGPNVRLGNNNHLHSHVVLDGNMELGDSNEVYSFACLGKRSQDLKFSDGMVSYVRIGSRNVFREYVTVNAASDKQTTIIGDDNLFLSYSHIAHDCVIGNHVIISSDSKLAGHVTVEDHAIINAKTGVIQFATIGKYAFVGGFNRVDRDILPFCISNGIPSTVRAINKIGLQRNGFSKETIDALHKAFKIIIYSGLTLDEAEKKIREELAHVPEAIYMIEFARRCRRGIARPNVGAEEKIGD